MKIHRNTDTHTQDKKKKTYRHKGMYLDTEIHGHRHTDTLIQIHTQTTDALAV